MVQQGLSAKERMEGALTNVQVITWVSRESWDIVFLSGRTLFLRRSKGVGQTIAAGLTLGPWLGGLLVDVIGEHGVQSQKELGADEIEAIKKDCINAYDFLHPEFPPCRLKKPFWGSSIIELGGKRWRFRFTKKQFLTFRQWAQRFKA